MLYLGFYIEKGLGVVKQRSQFPRFQEARINTRVAPLHIPFGSALLHPQLCLNPILFLQLIERESSHFESLSMADHHSDDLDELLDSKITSYLYISISLWIVEFTSELLQVLWMISRISTSTILPFRGPLFLSLSLNFCFKIWSFWCEFPNCAFELLIVEVKK